MAQPHKIKNQSPKNLYMKSLSETPYWSLIHKLNGQMLRELKGLLEATMEWSAADWICNVILLDRKYEDIIEVHFHTSATMFEGKVFDKSENGVVIDSEDTSPPPIEGRDETDVWALNRKVPLIDSFTSYCINTGSVVWVEDIHALENDHNNPLRDQYRPFKYVSVRSDYVISSEYVFPLRLRIGTNETILGVLNMECKKPENEFSKRKQQTVTGLILSLLDVHSPFLLTAGRVSQRNPFEDVFVEPADNSSDNVTSHRIIKYYEDVHLETVRAKVKNLLERWNKSSNKIDRK